MTPKPKGRSSSSTPSNRSAKKLKTAPNASILNFFRKAETKPLFVDDEIAASQQQLAAEDLQQSLATIKTDLEFDEDDELFTEDVSQDNAPNSAVDEPSSRNNEPGEGHRLPFEEADDSEEEPPGFRPLNTSDIKKESLTGAKDVVVKTENTQLSPQSLAPEQEDNYFSDSFLEFEPTLSCPICSVDLSGFDDVAANSHVNNCIDSSAVKQDSPLHSAGPAIKEERHMEPSTNTGFSRIMTANAETTAWKNAQKTEDSERGKPAASRICPFYKKLYSGRITMDAFRYSAISGCSAYFLSHFHSDHYIGLSGSWNHGKIYCSSVTASLVKKKLRVKEEFVVALPWEEDVIVPDGGGIRVRLISANHCPGSAIFLFTNTSNKRILHCGDFRACSSMIRHPELSRAKIDEVYLDTTYLNPKYCFPPQKEVIDACAELCVSLSTGSVSSEASNPFVKSNAASKIKPANGRLLVVIGTYSIGKERICVGIAKALKTKIFAVKSKRDICACLEDKELENLLTDDPNEGQVHMTGLRDITIESLRDYLKECKGTFGRVVGFKPTGWNYRPPVSRTDSPSVETILNAPSWRSSISATALSPSKGSSRDSALYPVPYSEHSSFRELTCFCCGLDIGKIIPTVNIHSEASRAKMKAWIMRWESYREKNGLYTIGDKEEF